MDSIDILKESYKNKFDVVLMTTFNFEIGFFEKNILRYLINRGGLKYISLYVDKKQMDKSLENGIPRFLGNQYLVNTVTTQKAFHPKIFLFLSRDKAKLFVGSCNLTKNGIFKNSEVFNIYEFNRKDGTNANLDIIQQAFNILKHVRNISNDFDKEIWNKCEEYEYLTEEVNKNDESFLIDNYEKSILDKVKEIINEDVKNIDIAVPYYDEELEVIDDIKEIFKADNIKLYIQNNEKNTFPFEFNNANKKIDEKYLYIFSNFRSKNGFYHGKVFRFTTPTKSYILYGSANCTKAALVQSFESGGNFECDIIEKGQKDEFNYFFEDFEDLKLVDKNEKYKNSIMKFESNNSNPDFIFETSILANDELNTSIIKSKKVNCKIKDIIINELKSDFEENQDGKIMITTNLENQPWNDRCSKLEIKIIDSEGKEYLVNGWYCNKNKLLYNREKRDMKYTEPDIDVSNLNIEDLKRDINNITKIMEIKINEIRIKRIRSRKL